jgi:Bacteriophage HK97-gp10, putative tail-component
MGVRLQWTGMEEFKQALRNLPEHLTTEAAEIVVSAAEGAGTTVQTNYPSRTGNLKRGVRVTRKQDKVSVSARVESRASHATIFEKGTRTRRTNRGWNRGRMPAAPSGEAMIPTVIRARQAMLLRLIALLEREGFLVAK